MNYAEPRVQRDGTGWKVEIPHRGRSVSRLWITDRRMRIGAAVVRVGGIAGVGTDPAHRRRGLSLAAADAGRAVSPLKTRAMRPGDLAAVRRLYGAANAGTTTSPTAAVSPRSPGRAPR